MKSSKKLQISSHLLFVYINNQDRKWRMLLLVFSSALAQAPVFDECCYQYTQSIRTSSKITLDCTMNKVFRVSAVGLQWYLTNFHCVLNWLICRKWDISRSRIARWPRYLTELYHALPSITRNALSSSLCSPFHSFHLVVKVEQVTLKYLHFLALTISSTL